MSLFINHYFSNYLMIRKIILLVCAISSALIQVQAQSPKKIITKKDVSFIEKTLAADNMQGRKIFTPGIAKASGFIESQFKKIGLDTLKGDNGYRQEFSINYIRHNVNHCTVNQQSLSDSAIIVQSTQPEINWTANDHIRSVVIGPDGSAMQEIRQNLQAEENTIVWVNTKFATLFARIKGYLDESFNSKPLPHSVIFILQDNVPEQFSIHVRNEKIAKKANNVVGILPGKERPGEMVVFSAHYDHLGIGKPQAGDSIYNGANDDASGTTAVIELAKYFKSLKNNARTLVFVTFTGEEEGGYGSHYFSEQMDPAKVVAMFNIEMIGTESKWGKNSAYITGYEKTDFGKILQRNLAGTDFTFHPDPYPKEQLFYRSDNATLARLGVPAHTISTSKMDDEPNYHQLSDEVNTLDMDNMTAIIQAIALSSGSIVNGQDTPTRVNIDDLEK